MKRVKVSGFGVHFLSADLLGQGPVAHFSDSHLLRDLYQALTVTHGSRFIVPSSGLDTKTISGTKLRVIHKVFLFYPRPSCSTYMFYSVLIMVKELKEKKNVYTFGRMF